MALPVLPAAVWFARQGKFVWFCASVVFILGCKAVLSFTVAAMGLWLLIFEKRRWCGVVAICAGVTWFVVSSQLIIPFFSGREAPAVGRYSYLGNSVLEIAQNLFLKPRLVFGKLLFPDNLGYLPLLLAPVIWGLSWTGIKPLVGAVPCVALNLLADYQPQKYLVDQYSLPALPFLLLAVISSLAAGKGWFQNPKAIIASSLVTFVWLAKFTYFGDRYLKYLSTWQETREAISLIDSQGSVLTSTRIASHLSHRPLIELTDYHSLPSDFKKYDYFLLDLSLSRDSGKNKTRFNNFLNKIQQTNLFSVKYRKDEVFLFTKK
ncbi:similar to membrane protein [Richelia intracellularis]|nr:similar to membrane protein [Richelia intracellularis]